MNGPCLIVRFSAIGDCVMTAWAVTALRHRYPGRMVWAVQERCAPVIATPDLVDSVVIADRNEWKKQRWSPKTWRSQMATFGALRRFQFETGLDFQGHSKTALCLKMSGARKRYASRATDPLAERLNQMVECGAGTQHEVLTAMQLVRSVFEDVQELPGRALMPAFQPVVGEYVSIQTGAGHPDKVYPKGHWAVVTKRLIEQGKRVVILGAPGDPDVNVEGAESLVGKTSLEETIAWVAGSKVHLAADTGTGHIAAAYGKPVVSVFGPTKPEIYTPWGGRTTVLRESDDPGQVKPDQVVEAALRAWEGGS